MFGIIIVWRVKHFLSEYLRVTLLFAQIFVSTSLAYSQTFPFKKNKPPSNKNKIEFSPIYSYFKYKGDSVKCKRMSQSDWERKLLCQILLWQRWFLDGKIIMNE